MAFFMDGFEQFDKSERLALDMRRAEYTLQGSVSLGDGRYDGSRALVFMRSSARRTFAWTQPVLAVGTAVRFSSRGGVLSVGDINVVIDSIDGAPFFLDKVGGLRPIRDRWYYIELVLDRGAATASLFINGRADGVATLPSTMMAMTSVLVTLNPYGLATSRLDDDAPQDNATRWYDDFYVSEGKKYDPIQVTTRFPDHDVATAWRTEAEGSHSEILGSLPVDVLDRYVFTNVDGARDAFTSEKGFPDGGAPVALGAIGLFRKTDNVYAAVEMDIAGRTARVEDIKQDWTYNYRYVEVTPLDTVGSIQGAPFGITVRKNP